MPAAIHSAKVSKIPGAISRSDLRPAGRNLCERTSASRSTKLAIAKRPTVIRRLSGSRPGAKCSTAAHISGAKTTRKARVRSEKAPTKT